MSPAPRALLAFSSGGVIGTPGGLIGLGGAEFRLPLLIDMFGFPALPAVIVNKAVSLVVVAAAMPFRMSTVPFSVIAEHWSVVLNLLGGSLAGAWIGAGWATRLASPTLMRVFAVLLAAIAVVLMTLHHPGAGAPLLAGAPLVVAGLGAGVGIGVFAALLGVAGGELRIPTLVLLFGIDVGVAGSLSLVVSLPTMLVGFVRYSRDRHFAVLFENRGFLLVMAAGSVIGAFLGGELLGIVPAAVLAPLLAAILLGSAVKIWRHGRGKG